jgi:hypothetical protein
MKSLPPKSKLPSNNSYWSQKSDIFYYNQGLEPITNKIGRSICYL